SNVSGDDAASFTLNANDGTVNPQVGSGNIDITGTNDAPVLGNNNLTITEGASVVFDSSMLSATDVDDSDPGLTFHIVGATNGQFERVSTGLVMTVFTQADITAGEVRFVHTGGATAPTYSVYVEDGTDNSATVPANITFTPLNDEQVLAVNTGSTVDEGSTGNPITTAMLQTTDGDNTADQLEYTLTTAPSNGTLYLSGMALSVTDTFTQDDIDNDRITYTHDGSETIADHFDFSVDDGAGTPSTGSFDITITPVNDNDPVARNDAITVDQGATITTLDGGATSVLANDSDADLPNDTLSVSLISAPSHGSLSLNADGSFTYIHDGSMNLADSFTYAVTDADGGITDTGSVTIAVNWINQPPTATHLNTGETYVEDTPFHLTDIQVSDVDSATVTATLTVSDPAAGSLSTATAGTVTATFSGGIWTASGPIDDVNTLLAGVTFTPAADYDSDFTIATRIEDGAGAAVTGVKRISATPVGDTPRVGSASAPMNGSSGLIVIRPHAQDGAEVTHLRISDITNGSLTLADGTPIHDGDFITVAQGESGIRFTPLVDSMAPGSFRVAASEDGVNVAQQSGTAIAVVTVTPPSANDPMIDSGVGAEAPAAPPTETESPPAEEILEVAAEDAAAPVLEETVAPVQAAAAQPTDSGSPKPAAARLPFLIKASRQFGGSKQTDAAAPAPEERQANADPAPRVETKEERPSERIEQIVRTHNRMSAQVYLNMVNALDAMQEEVAVESTITQTMVGSAIAVSTGLSVGYVVWLVRGGLLLSSLLSSLPAWQILDPLPVLAGRREDRDEDSDDSLAAILERQREAGAAKPTAADRDADAAERDRQP
ncbi:MAG: cadherin-like domain-containing protein, partial [Desulfosarcinaceae bacterium]|nr:cadherin-like domain-containing protein [Desulfosarcinaceae bacterium]